MKLKYLLIISFLIQGAHGFEWEGAIREEYLTKSAFTYNSDTFSRIMRELVDRGHKRISLQPRLAWSGNDKSLVYMPPIKTSLYDIAVATTRILQAGAVVTLKPIIYENLELGEGIPTERIRSRRPDLALITYEQLLVQFAQITRAHSVDRFIVGSGLVHLLENQNTTSRFEKMLQHLRNSLGPKTDLVLEVIGMEDITALMTAMKKREGKLDLRGLIDGISLVIDPALLLSHKIDMGEELKKSRLILESLLPGTPVHLSRITIPACALPREFRDELVCDDQPADRKLQLERFNNLKNILFSLEKQGINFGTVEILEASTDYEPKTINARYPYYNPLMRNPEVYALPAREEKRLPPYPLDNRQSTKKACIYFDKDHQDPSKDRIGEIHAMMLDTVLGAFPAWSVRRKEVQTFSSGDLTQCHAVIYFGTNFNQKLPPLFLEELTQAQASTPVVWFNYKFPEFAKVLKSKWQDPGFDVPLIIQPDSTPSPTNQKPGFYSQFDYKGEVFFKLSSWNPISNTFEASAELNLIDVKNRSQVEILSQARHDKTNIAQPYIVRSKNIWYVADSPFSFVHYEDRFYIFCDLLWDILSETPPSERVALVRIEDIHPKLNMQDIKRVTDYLSDENVPFAIAMIPFYSDLFGNNSHTKEPLFSPVTKFPDFRGYMNYAKVRGADFVMHGTIHSVGCLISGYDGITGDDYEFWLYPQNTPLPFDSVDWVTRRLEMGIRVFNDMKIRPVAFEAPHYAASVLDYVIFGKMFRWQYHRSIYMPHKILSDTGLPEHLRAFNCSPDKCGDERRMVLNNIKVEADHTTFSGINSPFITYRDVYGQSIIPETLGMIDFVFYPSHTWRPISTPEDIIRRAKKLKVIRGAVASFFWHPLVLDRNNVYYQQNPGSYEKMGGMKSLSLVIDGLRELGYVFKSTSDKTLFPDEV